MRLLSYTQISTYQQCPLRYRLQYVEGLQETPKPYFAFGHSLHAAVEWFYQAPLVPPTREELLAYLDTVWESEGYASPQEEERHRAEARAILSRFWFIHAADYRPATATEHPFELDLGGIGLRGVIDRVDQDHQAGCLDILDYKSGRYQWTPHELEDHLQLTLYQVAAERVFQQPVRRLTLYHLRSNLPFSSQARSQAVLRKAEELVHEVAEQIEAGRFDPTPSRFCPCDFVQYCPVFRGTRPIPVAVVPAAPLLDPETA